MFDFTVKSKIKDYNVSFIHNFRVVLSEQLHEGDYIIIDKNIVSMYKSDVRSILNNYSHQIIDANETQKSYEGIIPVIKTLIEEGFKKNNRLIAIGGGITQDITAFISSIMYRGVEWLFFPTTLLAQCDSCIGSKTSINFGLYKNQVGGFYPPGAIYIDTDFLATLPQKDIMSGLGEMCHYFPIAGKDDFYRYRSDFLKAPEDKKIMEGLIARSLEIKKGYIEIDEFDKNERQVFNYGHSFGHAIETLTDYRLPHGIAVSYGMDMANYVSNKMGYLDISIRDEMRDVLQNIWRETSIDDISIDKFINALMKDKKNVGNELRLILNKGYGKIFKASVKPDNSFVNIIKQYFAEELN